MQGRVMRSTLINQEHQAAKLFLFLFYIIALAYDFLYFYILPRYVWIANTEIGFPEGGLGFGIHMIIFGLLPIAIYLFRTNRPGLIKYVYFLTYIFIHSLNELMIYLGSFQVYESGNVLELFFILFSPLFVNKRFFWLVSVGTISKYSLIGLLIQAPNVLIPLALVALFSIVAYIILNRFEGYVDGVTRSYHLQMEGIVKGIVTTLELKDPYTRGHSQRVAAYSQLLAEKAGQFSPEELQAFNYACLLHDVGKVNIPDQILMKPSQLTDDEYEVIKTHPVVGAETVKGIEGLENCIDVIRHHHERWDGTGYPDQLTGTDTPILARITAIADAFDAMTSSRSYRSAMSVDEAYQRIIKGKGKQFDPELVELFKSVYPSWVELQKSTKWKEIQFHSLEAVISSIERR